ncbi:ATP-binding cassette domain-containing protein [Streptomyces griseorubiginosus]|uniref:branched-chain amino acid ABC transporter ATP-binding protein/permease n=1 Tax=Streptomyces griseorubiginosus TaxID=67304 RepID=UPI002E81D151|nr:ATP-binding cassette domain-containing protein [Streptomyces griseorubiginosus]WUB41843.1 ATP-binding cassette domain-containing protein [Streptomyces griseorubiginosus]WUB50363.1 ATP-binding cassette domain-containing protein [Streptomyces griseorubiginosus]
MVFNRSLLARAALGPAAGAVLMALMASGAIPAYQMYSVGLAAVYTIVVLSVGLLAGWSGIWSVGHPAFFAIGAYFAAYGSGHDWPLETVVLGAVATGAALGAFLGYAGARFSVLYIALLTLAFTMVTLELVNRWSGVTGGDQGVPVVQLRSALGFGTLLGGGTEAQYLAVGAAAVVLALAVPAAASGLRMRLVAAKSHPPAARTLGIAPEAQSALSFAVSGACTCFAGVLLGLLTGFVSPDPFSLAFGISLIGACVLGGVGTVVGAVAGGIYLTWNPSLSSAVGLPQPIVQGLVLIGVLLFLPGGVVPFLAKLARRVRRRPDTELPSPAGDSADLDPVPSEAVGDAPVLLRMEHVSVSYGGLKALEDASLSLRQNEILAVIGPNGAGKTTLLNALSGLTGNGRVSGTADFDGRPLLKARATARRRLGIGRTFQHAEVFSELTVAENVLCTRRRITAKDRDEVARLLHSVGLAEVADRRPAELPFGLQKRLDLARAMAEKPKLLVLDEPFGGLDADERALLARHIRRLHADGTAVVVIDHVLDDLFSVAHRVLAFDFGRTIGEGTPDTVLEDPQVRSSYLGTVDGRTRPPEHIGDRSMIRLDGVGHTYGGVVALRDIDLDVRQGVVLGIAGANGAGKSTLAGILHGSLQPARGTRESEGTVRTSLAPEGRALFKTLSLRENLEVAAYAAGITGAPLRERLEETVEWLPVRLRDRMSAPAGGLSGGEQQMLAIARALIARPDVLIVDEPALGLAPALVDEVYDRLARLAHDGLTVVLLEQLLSRALSVCHEVAVLHEGVVAAHGRPGDPAFVALAEAAYFSGDPEAATPAAPSARTSPVEIP